MGAGEDARHAPGQQAEAHHPGTSIRRSVGDRSADRVAATYSRPSGFCSAHRQAIFHSAFGLMTHNEQ